jgi:uncharacterized protein (UPF0210 family)
LEKVETESDKRSKEGQSAQKDDEISAIGVYHQQKYQNEEKSFIQNAPDDIKGDDISYVSCTHVTTGERKNMQAMVLNRSPYI